MKREDYFWPKVDRSGSCWEWRASLDTDGYGRFWNGKRCVKAHRFAYELLIGSIPERLELDHLCRNIICVNPAHLEPVSHRTNMMRGISGDRAAKTHCANGHAFTPANTINRPNGTRNCRACNAAAQRRYQARKKVA